MHVSGHTANYCTSLTVNGILIGERFFCFPFRIVIVRSVTRASVKRYSNLTIACNVPSSSQLRPTLVRCIFGFIEDFVIIYNFYRVWYFIQNLLGNVVSLISNAQGFSLKLIIWEDYKTGQTFTEYRLLREDKTTNNKNILDLRKHYSLMIQNTMYLLLFCPALYSCLKNKHKNQSKIKTTMLNLIQHLTHFKLTQQ